MPLAGALYNTVGLVGPSTSQAGTLVEVDFANNPGASVHTWVDISAYVRSIAIRRGRQHELDRIEAGTLALHLINSDRRFDPTYTSGPYYPNVRPMRRARVRAFRGTVRETLFTGFVESWHQRLVGEAIILCDVRAVDGFKPLAMVHLNGSYEHERTDARITGVLDNIGWPAADRVLDVGISSCVETTLASAPALSHLQDVAQSENGLLYMDGRGRVVFRDRHSVYESTASVASFADSAGGLGYVGLEMQHGDANIWNEVRIGREGSTVVAVWSDTATSQARYLRRTLARTLLVDNDAETSAAAEHLLNRYKDDALRITQVTLSPDTDSNVWRHALGRDIGDRVTVRRTPTVGGEISQESLIEGIEHNIAAGRLWETKWALSPIGANLLTGARIILDDPVYGVLDTATGETTGTFVY